MAACAPSSHVLVGTARPPIAPSLVTVYSQAPQQFEVVLDGLAEPDAGIEQDALAGDALAEGDAELAEFVMRHHVKSAREAFALLSQADIERDKKINGEELPS